MSADRLTPIPPEVESQYSRPISEGAEAELGVIHEVLGNGYIVLLDYLGNDASIADAARVSYAKGTKSTSDDRSLIRYLYRNKHTSPFEMVEFKFQVRMPIVVARQWVRHRTASINEESGRYSVMKDEFYVPEVTAIATQSKDNKQGRGESVSDELAIEYQEMFRSYYKNSYEFYQFLLNIDDDGNVLDPDRPTLARELARMPLSLSIYTSWVWKCDLRNTLHFLNLRKDLHAQYEIRQYADAMGEIVRKAVPIAYEAFEDYDLYATSFSRVEQAILSQIVANPEAVKNKGAEIFAKDLGLTNKREREEFLAKLANMGINF